MIIVAKYAKLLQLKSVGRTSNNKDNLPQKEYSSIHQVLEKQRQQRKFVDDQYEKRKSLQKITTYYDSNEIEFKLYMQHDCERSWYIFALMNYNKLGFKKFSNIAYLNNFTYAYSELRKKKDEERWPLLKVEESLTPAQVLIGQKNIFDYMNTNHFFKPFDRDSQWLPLSIDYINQSIKKPLQALFWHPVLIGQYSFDGDTAAYRGTKNYDLIAVLRLNLQKILKRSLIGIYKILTQQKQYQQAKDKFLKGVNEWSKLIQKDGYCGGAQPNYVDFYLYSIIKCKSGSRFFNKFLEEKPDKAFILWLRRMDADCRFDRDRRTIL